MTENKTYDNIAKWLSGNMTSEEQQLFENWLKEDPAHEDLLEEVTAIWTAAEQKDKTVFEKEMAWDIISKKIKDNPAKEKTTIRQLNPHWMQLLKMAAVFILCIAVSFWVFKPAPVQLPEEMFTVEATDKPKEHVLPDGSKIWLNKNTRIAYEESFQQRFVSLVGEAFFEVTPDKKRPFEITAGNSRTRVLGTAFNLRAYPEEKNIELVVTHGKVAFHPIEKTVEKEAVILKKEEAVSLDKHSNKLSRKKATSQNAIAWKTGKLEFKETPLHEIIQALERTHPVKFQLEFPEIKNCIGTTNFEDETLEEILEMLEYILTTKITQQDNYYLITGKTCIEKMKEN